MLKGNQEGLEEYKKLKKQESFIESFLKKKIRSKDSPDLSKKDQENLQANGILGSFRTTEELQEFLQTYKTLSEVNKISEKELILSIEKDWKEEQKMKSFRDIQLDYQDFLDETAHDKISSERLKRPLPRASSSK